MPMEQEKARGPAVFGVNSMVVSPVLGRSLLILRAGMVKEREQDWTLFVISFSLVSIPLLRVMELGV